MKVVQLASGKVRIVLNASEFSALQAIVEEGFGPAKKAVGGRGFGVFEEGLSVDEVKEKKPGRGNPAFGDKHAIPAGE